MKYCVGVLKFSLILFGLFKIEFLLADTLEKSNMRHFRHEVSVSIGGFGVRSGWSDDYENDVMNKFGLVVGKAGGGDGAYGKGIIYQSYGEPDLRRDNVLKTISYYYHFNHKIAVGGLFTFGNVKDWLGYPEVHRQGETQRTGYTYVMGTSMFIMPSAKWLYLNNRWCSLYMKTSLGIHYQSLHLDSETIASEQTDKYSKKHLGFAYNVIPLGWEIGKQHFRWFMELGFCPKTNFQTGIIIRFCTY